MIKIIEKEEIWISLTTGEVVETSIEARELYKAGHNIRFQYRYRYNDGEWGRWKYGIPWEH